MKIIKKVMFVIILIIPFLVSAKDLNSEDNNYDDDNYVVVAETIKYYKTVSIFNNSNIMRIANVGEMSSLTTEVNKDEYDNAIPTIAPVASLSNTKVDTFYQTETIYKKLTTTIEKNSTYYRYTTNLYWKNIPKFRSYDIIAIGYYNDVELWDENLVMFVQKYCQDEIWCYTGGAGTDVVKEYGTAEIFHLPDEKIISLEQTLSLRMKKARNFIVDQQIAAGDYAHATKAVTRNFACNNFSLGVGGLLLNERAFDYYDSTPAAIATWSGTW